MHPTVDRFDWQKLITLSSVRQSTDSITTIFQWPHEFSGPTGVAGGCSRCWFRPTKARGTVDLGIEELAVVLDEVRRGDARGWVGGYEFVSPPK